MKAITQNVYGSADVLHLAEVDKPAVGPATYWCGRRGRDLRWRVAPDDRPADAASLPGLRTPRSEGARARRNSPGRSRPSGARHPVQPGDEVYGVAEGSFAEFASRRRSGRAEAGHPDFEQAAAVPTSAITALQALRDRAG